MVTRRRRIPAPTSNVARSPGSADLFDVLDRVLAKGIVIDAWVRLERLRELRHLGHQTNDRSCRGPAVPRFVRVVRQKLLRGHALFEFFEPVQHHVESWIRRRAAALRRVGIDYPNELLTVWRYVVVARIEWQIGECAFAR